MIVAAAQASPVFLDREATIDKACALVDQARSKGAELLAFPEAFVPAYPDWVWSVPAKDKKLLGALYGELLAQAVTVPSPSTDRLCEAARRALHAPRGRHQRAERRRERVEPVQHPAVHR